jgi:hypothetical protein
VALTSERSGRSAVAVEEADGCEDEDDIDGDDDGRCGCGGTDSDVTRGVAEAEGDAGVADEGG